MDTAFFLAIKYFPIYFTITSILAILYTWLRVLCLDREHLLSCPLDFYSTKALISAYKKSRLYSVAAGVILVLNIVTFNFGFYVLTQIFFWFYHKKPVPLKEEPDFPEAQPFLKDMEHQYHMSRLDRIKPFLADTLLQSQANCAYRFIHSLQNDSHIQQNEQSLKVILTLSLTPFWNNGNAPKIESLLLALLHENLPEFSDNSSSFYAAERYCDDIYTSLQHLPKKFKNYPMYICVELFNQLDMSYSYRETLFKKYIDYIECLHMLTSYAKNPNRFS